MIAEASQVEKVLEDLISRLTKSASTPEIRAAIIDAKRLRTVTTRWSAIPPQPDARREMMARVMDLIARTGLSERDRGSDPARPITSAAPPPPTPRQSVPAPSPSAPALKREEAPRVASFRQYEELGQTRPRPVREPVRPQSLPISQKPTVPPAAHILGIPQDMFGPPTIEPQGKPAAERSISPLPERSISPLPERSISPLPQRAVSLLAQRSMSPARPLPQRSMSPAPAWRSNPSQAPARGRSGQHEAVADPRREDPAPPSGDAGKRTAQTIQFNSSFLNNPEAQRQPDSDSPPTRERVNAPPPALSPPVAPTPRRTTSTAPPPLRARAPHRAATIAGIPEANEAMIAAILNRPTAPVDEPFEEVAKRSALPTLSPPASPSSEPGSGPLSSPSDRKRSKETLMMGALTAAEALKAVRNARAPALPADFEDVEFEPPPSTKPSNPPESTPAVFGFGKPSSRSNHRIEGLSTKISETNLAPVAPSRTTQRPPPPTREPASQPQQPASQPQQHSQRTVVAPGISIVKPGAAAWQPHATQRGISQKVVYRDPRSGLYAALVKLAPGATLPRRRHAMTEEIFVVSGIATIDGHVLESGDYLRAEADTIHPSMTTKHGCTFFVMAGDHDEVLDD